MKRTEQADEHVAGRYRARDLVSVPGLISLLRIPLAALFVATVDTPWLALSVIVAAGVSDLLDGWYARRLGITSPTGAALDPVTDKIFATTVAVTLLLRGGLSLGQILLLNVRELGEIPLMLWMLFSSRVRVRRGAHASANVPGKLTTVVQFGAIASALFHLPQTDAWVAATALMGAFAAAIYWRRELRRVTRVPSSTSDLDPHA